MHSLLMQATNVLPCKATLYGKSFERRRILYLRKSVPVVRAGRDLDSGDYAGRIVDENMIVLRTRIRDLKISEEGRQHTPVSAHHCIDWEKDYYNYELTHQQKDGYEGNGFLQTWMMHSRPGSVVGLVAVLSLSAGVMATWLFFAAIEVVKGLSS